MEFTGYTFQYKKIIQDEVEKIFFAWKKQTDKQVPQLKKISRLLVLSNKQGKMIRGALVYLGYELFSSVPHKQLVQLAAAYEILHTSLLIHDDIMDKSLLRRGKPSVFQQLGGNHYGISQAISLGDIGFFLALDILSKIKIPERRKEKIVSYFITTILETINGQMLDVALAQKIGVVSEKDVLQIARYKTAYYSLVGPLVVGALLAGANKKIIEKLSHFGEHLGIAFQLQDDILGVFGEEKVIGKSATSDIEEGKNTLLFLTAYKNANSEQHAFLLETYGNGKITKRQHKMLQSLFLETNALTYVEKKIEQHAAQARDIISVVTRDLNKQELLMNFINFLLERKK